jgi:hypothetical protein
MHECIFVDKVCLEILHECFVSRESITHSVQACMAGMDEDRFSTLIHMHATTYRDDLLVIFPP